MASTDGTGELLQGTLAMLILKALMVRPMHGYGVARWVEDTTGDVLRVEEGSLYPALRRIEDRGWVTSAWGLSENNRRARFYTITPAGRTQLRAEPAWRRYLRFWGPNVEADVDDELAFHLEMRQRDYEARGLPPAEARRAARD